MLKEFKEFALKGNMIDLAVGVIIGTAFGTVVKSLVDDVLMPLLSGLFRIPDFSNIFIVLRNPTNLDFSSLAAAREAGASVIAIGSFINAFIAFILVAWAIFFMVKGMNKLRKSTHIETGPTEVQLLTEIRDTLKASK